jgi:hypothetical protein
MAVEVASALSGRANPLRRTQHSELVLNIGILAPMATINQNEKQKEVCDNEADLARKSAAYT